MFTNLDITDMETGYKLFRREIIQGIDLKEDRFGFEPEVTAKVSQTRCRVYECAISYLPRTPEEGKKINWKDGVHALYCILHYGAPSAPLAMQLAIYFVIGSICAVVNVAVFSMLFHGGLSVEMATPASFAFAAALNYVLCIAILFHHKARWNTFGELIAYLCTVLFMGLVDYGLTIGFIATGTAGYIQQGHCDRLSALWVIFCCVGSSSSRSRGSSGFDQMLPYGSILHGFVAANVAPDATIKKASTS